MLRKVQWVILVLGLCLVGVWQMGSANCTPEDGGAGNDTITCDNALPNPFTPGNNTIDGAGGADVIIINGNSTVNGAILGDGDGVGGFLNDHGGNDTITNNGELNGVIIGDWVNGNGGADVITNNGTLTGDIWGDTANTGGNDLITNTNTLNGNIFGDNAAGTNGNDIIINTGTITGSIFGDLGGLDGNDLIIIQVGSTVGGEIDGENGNDIIRFTNVDDAAQAIINTCTNFANCDITINGKTYRIRNFESLQTVAAFVAQALEPDSRITVFIPQEICRGKIKVFRLLNGDLDIFSGFDLLPPNGFGVAVAPLSDILAGVTGFASNDFGWSSTVTRAADGKITVQVFDQNKTRVDACTF